MMKFNFLNEAKLTAFYLPTFNTITTNLFLGVDLPTLDCGKFKEEIKVELKVTNYRVPVNAVLNIQLQKYDNQLFLISVKLADPRVTCWC